MIENYKKFNIYKPYERFTWTRSRIIGAFFWIILLILIFLFYILKIPEEKIPSWLMWCTLIPFIAYLINIWFHEELRGKIEGDLIFEIDKITINKEVLFIKDLKKIQIIKKDYKNSFISHNAFDGAWSQGCKNELIITLTNKQIKCFFQIENSKELSQIYDQIENYVDHGLMTKEEKNNILNTRW